MKKTYILLLLSLSTSLNIYAEEANFSWVNASGSTTSDQGKSIVYSPAGFIYVTGSFQGSVDFDGAGSLAPITSLGSSDVFIAKYDLSGGVVWIKSVGGTNSDEGASIDLDVDGNLYVTGLFYGTADFNPSATTNNLTAAGNADIFILKLNENGNYIWAKKIGGAFDDYSNDISIDGEGKVITTGTFSGTVDFNPNAAVANLVSAGNTDIFISKLDSSGNYIWAKRIGNNLLDDALTVKTDASNNIFIGGSFKGTVDFNPNAGIDSLVSAGDSDAYICKLDSAGNYIFAQRFGNIYADNIRSISISSSGSVHAFGNFVNSVNFDFDGSSVDGQLVSLAGITDMFILKITNGGTFIWVKQLGGTATDQGIAITTDADESVYTTGSFQLTADFNPGAGVSNLTSGGTSNGFVSKLNSAGDFVWAKQITGTNYSAGFNLVVDPNKNVYTTGVFFGSVDMNPSTTVTQTVVSTGQSDYFLLKYNFAFSLPVTLTEFSAKLENNITKITWATESEKDNAYFIVERSENGLEFTDLEKVEAAGPSNIQLNYFTTDHNPNKYGKTYYRLKQVDLDGTETLSDIISVQINREQLGLQIFPNPSVSQLNILVPEQLYFKTLQMELIDVTGAIRMNEIYSELTSSNKLKKLNISQLPAGIYLVRITSNLGQVYTQRIQKN